MLELRSKVRVGVMHAWFEGFRRRRYAENCLPSRRGSETDETHICASADAPPRQEGMPDPTAVRQRWGYTDSEPNMPSAETLGAICVQRFDGSRNSAIHTTYRSSLRSSSIQEPRYPLLRVVIG